jgi:hypothetical protein
MLWYWYVMNDPHPPIELKKEKESGKRVKLQASEAARN